MIVPKNEKKYKAGHNIALKEGKAGKFRTWYAAHPKATSNSLVLVRIIGASAPRQAGLKASEVYWSAGPGLVVNENFKHSHKSQAEEQRAAAADFNDPSITARERGAGNGWAS